MITWVTRRQKTVQLSHLGGSNAPPKCCDCYGSCWYFLASLQEDWLHIYTHSNKAIIRNETDWLYGMMCGWCIYYRAWYSTYLTFIVPDFQVRPETEHSSYNQIQQALIEVSRTRAIIGFVSLSLHSSWSQRLLNTHTFQQTDNQNMIRFRLQGYLKLIHFLFQANTDGGTANRLLCTSPSF